MTDPQLGVLMLVLFIFLIMLGFPIAFTLMAMGVGFAFLAYDGNMDAVASLLVQRTWSVMTNDVLISVPLFVFMGYIVERANILDRLFRSIQLASGALPGSLAIATLATCALFATATGIVGAVVSAEPSPPRALPRFVIRRSTHDPRAGSAPLSTEPFRGIRPASLAFAAPCPVKLGNTHKETL